MLTAEMRGKTTADWLAELELNKVKKAGTFLDGCKIFLSGFTDSEQVRRLISLFLTLSLLPCSGPAGPSVEVRWRGET